MEQDLIIPRDTSVYKPNQEIREQIINFQTMLQNVDDEDYIVVDDKNSTKLCPLKHTFSDGIYVREIFIPAGMFIVGKLEIL